jgi:hypothetical protein
MSIKETANKVAPYLYAGALRVAADDLSDALRGQLGRAVPREYLDLPVVDGVLRLAAAALLTTLPERAQGAWVQDLRQELLISGAGRGIAQLQSALLQTATVVYERLQGAAEPPALTAEPEEGE